MFSGLDKNVFSCIKEPNNHWLHGRRQSDKKGLLTMTMWSLIIFRFRLIQSIGWNTPTENGYRSDKMDGVFPLKMGTNLQGSGKYHVFLSLYNMDLNILKKIRIRITLFYIEVLKLQTLGVMKY